MVSRLAEFRIPNLEWEWFVEAMVICLGLLKQIKTLQLKNPSSPSKHMCSSSLQRSKLVGKCHRAVACYNFRASGSVLWGFVSWSSGWSGLRMVKVVRIQGWGVEEGAARFTAKQVGRLLLQFRWALKMANGWRNDAAIQPFPERIHRHTHL